MVVVVMHKDSLLEVDIKVIMVAQLSAKKTPTLITNNHNLKLKKDMNVS